MSIPHLIAFSPTHTHTHAHTSYSCMFTISPSLPSEMGGSEVNPNHEPHLPRGGITAEMQVNWSRRYIQYNSIATDTHTHTPAVCHC